MVGFQLFRMPSDSSPAEWIFALGSFGVALAGTVATYRGICWIKRQPAGWRALDVGRYTWITLIVLSWGAGFGFAVYLHLFVP